MTAWEARTESDSNTEGQSNPTLYLGSGAGAGRGETREPSRPRPTELSGHTRSHGTDGLGTKNNAHKVDLRHLVVRPLIDRQHRGKLSHSPSAQAWCPPSKGSPSRRETQLVAPALLPRSTRHLLEEASAGKDRTSRTNPSISLVKQQHPVMACPQTYLLSSYPNATKHQKKPGLLDQRNTIKSYQDFSKTFYKTPPPFRVDRMVRCGLDKSLIKGTKRLGCSSYTELDLLASTLLDGLQESLY